jgi:hypothetical protein
MDHEYLLYYGENLGESPPNFHSISEMSVLVCLMFLDGWDSSIIIVDNEQLYNELVVDARSQLWFLLARTYLR